jgi:hypothetical protein
MELAMKATYYKHLWIQEPDTSAFECYVCEERTVRAEGVPGWVTINKNRDEPCLVEFDYKGEL